VLGAVLRAFLAGFGACLAGFGACGLLTCGVEELGVTFFSSSGTSAELGITSWVNGGDVKLSRRVCRACSAAFGAAALKNPEEQLTADAGTWLWLADASVVLVLGIGLHVTTAVDGT